MNTPYKRMGVSAIGVRFEEDCLPSPDVRTSVGTSFLLHEIGNKDVLSAMIPANTARDPESRNSLTKQGEHGGRAVVVVNANADDLARLAVNETVDDNLVANEA